MVEGAADGASRRLDRRLALAGSVLVASLASLVYLRTLTFGFVYDDLPQVVNNPLLGRSDIWLRAFVDDVWSHHLLGAQYYRPVFLLWLAANYALFEHAAWGWHLTSVAVHAVASVLVLWVGVRLGLERFAAVLAGCLFAVHPAHVESVAWVSGITDPLMTMFLLACLLLHLRWRGGAGRAPLCGLLAPLAFAAALLDKETAVVFVAIILALPFLGLGGRERDHFGLRAQCMESLVGASPYVAVVALYLAARAATVGAVGLEGGAALRIELLTAPSLLWQYSLRLFWPMNLSPVYSVDYIERLSARGVAAPAIGVLGLCAASLWSKGSRSLCVLLLGIIALPLAPVLLISKLPLEDFFHDRYLYLPSVGFSLLVAGWVASLPTGKAKLLGQPAARLGVAVLLVGACAVVTARESAVWRDDLTLFTRVVERAPDNNVALTSYASKLLLAGEISAAQAIYRRVIEMAPDRWEALYGLGRVHFLRRDYVTALGWLERARAVRPQDADQHVQLGYAHLYLGRPEAAETSFRRALELRPLGAGIRYALGVALEARGRLAEALAAFEAELALSPNEPRVRSRVDALNRRLAEE